MSTDVLVTDVQRELAAAQADLAALDSAVGTVEEQLDRAQQYAGELHEVHARLSTELVEAQAVATNLASTNAAVDVALERYYATLLPLQAMVSEVGRADGLVAQTGKRLEVLREHQRRATARVADLEANQAAERESFSSASADLRLRLGRLRERIR